MLLVFIIIGAALLGIPLAFALNAIAKLLTGTQDLD